nr:MAG TPA: hypothetical protein [Caudoviricetes sp.]
MGFSGPLLPARSRYRNTPDQRLRKRQRLSDLLRR